MREPLLPARWGSDTRGLTFHPADKNVIGKWLVTRLLIRRALRSTFRGVFVRADPAALRLREPDMPVIVCATHPGWWDGYMTHVLNEAVFRHNAYLMMDEENLARYWFLCWAGVFGVDRRNARHALASIEYIAAKLRTEPRCALWVFPQGEIAHPDARPIRLFGGFAKVVRQVGRTCALVPLALRYEFLKEQAPEIYVRVGPPVVVGGEGFSSPEAIHLMTEAMEREAGALHDDLTSGDLAVYRKVLGGKGSVNRAWDGALRVAGSLRRTR